MTSTAAPEKTPLLSVRNLRIHFGSKEVVCGVDFDVQAGEKLALVGESGSGKTITALALLRLAGEAARIEGQAVFAGRDLLQLSERQMRGVRGGDVAMIFQEPMTALNPLMTVGAQIGEVLQLKQSLTGARWTTVQYKGNAPATTDLLGGQVDFNFDQLSVALPYIKEGRLRALAVTGDQRHPDMPDVPTLVEAGYPDAVHYSWTSLWLKNGTPQPIVDTLANTMLGILAEPASRDFVASNSGEIMPLGPAAMRQFQLAEIERFTKAVRSLNFALL